jgi:hypothetical protein
VRQRTVLLLVLLVLGRAPSLAHPLDNSYAELHLATNVVTARFTFRLACIQPFSLGPAAITSMADPVEASAQKIHDHLKANVRVEADAGAGACDLVGESHRVDADDDTLDCLFAWRWVKPICQFRLHYGAFADVDPTHICFAVVRAGDREEQHVLTSENRELAVEMDRGAPDAPLWAQVREFTALGVHHIFTGYDHVAFIIGLLLITRTFVGLVKIVTAFTLAHSATLAAATLGWVSAPAALVEPAITLTIAAVGIENLWRVRQPAFYDSPGRLPPAGKRWIVAFCFGLIHGFGFATVLKEMNLSPQGIAVSLVCFNVGVELGQVVIVAIPFPILYFIERRRRRAHRALVRTGSGVIVALAAFWFAQRVGWI